MNTTPLQNLAPRSPSHEPQTPAARRPRSASQDSIVSISPVRGALLSGTAYAVLAQGVQLTVPQLARPVAGMTMLAGVAAAAEGHAAAQSTNSTRMMRPRTVRAAGLATSLAPTAVQYLRGGRIADIWAPRSNEMGLIWCALFLSCAAGFSRVAREDALQPMGRRAMISQAQAGTKNAYRAVIALSALALLSVTANGFAQTSSGSLGPVAPESSEPGLTIMPKIASFIFLLLGAVADNDARRLSGMTDPIAIGAAVVSIPRLIELFLPQEPSALVSP